PAIERAIEASRTKRPEHEEEHEQRNLPNERAVVAVEIRDGACENEETEREDDRDRRPRAGRRPRSRREPCGQPDADRRERPWRLVARVIPTRSKERIANRPLALPRHDAIRGAERGRVPEDESRESAGR